MPYKLVIFDFDGTLADSEAWFFAAFNGVAERYRLRKVDAGEVEELRGKSSREIVRRLGVPAWKLPLIARHIRRLARDSTDRAALFPGVETMLRRLSGRGALIGVVSSNAEEVVRRTLGPGLCATIGYFECGASLFGKARRIRRVLRCSGVAASEAIFIGDETRDVEAARDAGVAAGGVLWGYARAAAFASTGATMFASVEEMTDALG
jgi:phosphoglycolate phosphatase